MHVERIIRVYLCFKQDQEHLQTQNHKVLALITAVDCEVSESEFGTSFVYSDDDSTYHPPTAQPALEELLV